MRAHQKNNGLNARNRRRLAKKRTQRALEKARQTILASLAERSCGECNACCTTLYVPELEKPPNRPCLHARSSGLARCGIYQDRPSSCRNFNCLWRQGLLGPEHRPDKIGIMFDVNLDGSPFQHRLVVARSLRPGAIDAAMKELMTIAAKGMLLYLIEGDRRRFMGPEELVREAQDFARRRLPVT